MTSINALKVIPLSEKLKYKVESITTIDPYICIGTNEGKILFFKFSLDNLAQNSSEVDFFTADKEMNLRRGKNKVRQLESMPDMGLILSRCDSHLDVLKCTRDSVDMGSQVPVEQIKHFVLDSAKNTYRVGTLSNSMRLISIFNYTGTSWSPFKEVELNEPVSSFKNSYYYFVLLGKTVAFAGKKDYQIKNIDSNDDPTVLFPFIKDNPVLTAFETDQGAEFFMLQDVPPSPVGVSVNNKGTPVNRDKIIFKSPPTVMSVYDPYVLTVQANNLEVFDLYSSKPVQSIPLPKIYALSTGLRAIYAYNDHSIYCLLPSPIEEQVKNLIAAGFADKGLNLYISACRKNENFKEKLGSLQEFAGDEAMKNIQFEQAFKMYKLSSTVDPKRIIQLFPGLTPYQSNKPTLDKVIANYLLSQPNAKIQMTDKNEVIKDAKRHLMSYLESYKTRGKRDAALLAEIDEALLKLYAELKPSSFKSQLQITKNIKFEEMEKYLQSLNRWSTLALLYKSGGLSSKALDIWQKIGTKEINDSDTNPVDETVEVLSISNDFDLLCKHSNWVYDANPQKFLLIWMNNERKPNYLPHSKVVEYLQKYGPTVVKCYLEFLVLNVKVEDPAFHVSLINNYLKEIISLSKNDGALEKSTRELKESSNSTTQAQSIRAAMKSPQQTMDALTLARKKFLTILKESSTYDPKDVLEEILKNIPDLKEEKIVLYNRLGNHDSALAVIVNELKDLKRAEEYCLSGNMYPDKSNQTHNGDETVKAGLETFSQSTRTSSQLLSLLKIHLNADALQNAVDLLNKYPSSFDPLKVLTLLPPDTSLKAVSSFLRNSLKNSLHQVNHTHVVKSIETSQQLKYSLEKMKIEESHVTITRESTCQVTGALIGDRSFARYPNGVIVSMVARDFDLTTCPITGRDFKKKPWHF